MENSSINGPLISPISTWKLRPVQVTRLPVLPQQMALEESLPVAFGDLASCRTCSLGLEEQTKRLQKDMKKSTDADLAMSKSAVKISLDLLSNPLCEQDQDFLNMVTALDTAMKRMDAFNQEKVNQIQKTVIEPLKKFGSVFPSLNMAVKRREQALQDYRRLQAKVEKYEEKEKTGPVLAKLHQAREELRPVRDDFEAKNKQLLDEMPRFYGSRLDYFQPSFESLIRAQVVYYSEMHKIFGDLTQQLDQPGHSDEQRERENEAKLSELRALSIVADD
nr:bridging integrator 3 isoform X1 [Urocitellus parryii]